MELTGHAKGRWRERFPDLDVRLEFAQARRPGRKTRAKLRAQLPSRRRELGHFAGRYFLISPRGVVFVCAPPTLVITVFPLTGSSDWRRRSAFANEVVTPE